MLLLFRDVLFCKSIVPTDSAAYVTVRGFNVCNRKSVYVTVRGFNVCNRKGVQCM